MKLLMSYFRLVVLKSSNICDDEKLHERKMHIVLVNPGFVRRLSWNVCRKQRFV